MTPTFVSLLCLVLAVYDAKSQEVGFENLYESNPEEMLDVPMTFTGKAPKWLTGYLVRVGPALFEIGNNPKSYVNNNLDGFSKVALWKFLGNQKLLFSTKFVRSTYYNESLASNKFTSNIFLEQPFPALTQPELERSREVGVDNMVINIVDYPDLVNRTVNYAATTDIWPVYEISLDDLSTLSKVTPPIADASASFPQESPEFIKQLSTSHPLPDPSNQFNRIDLLIQAALNSGEKNVLKVVRINSLRKTEVIASLDIPEVPLIHSFSVSQTKAAILMHPYILNVPCMVNNTGNCYYWKTGNDTITLYIVDLHTGNVIDVQVPKIFSYHHINCFDEKEDQLVVDLVAYDSPVMFEKFDMKKMKDVATRKLIESQGKIKRIRVFLSNKTAELTTIPSPTPKSLVASSLEYPVINEFNRSKPYCFVYGIVEKMDGKNLGNMGVAKKDVCTDDVLQSDALFKLEGWYPSEPTFVPNPFPVSEDDGVLLVPYTNGQEKKTHLIILDAKDLSLIDTANGPTLIPQSQHGRYITK